MRNALTGVSLAQIRQTDTNSLMRLSDVANAIVKNSLLQQERIRAGKAIQRINKELEKRQR